MPNADKMFDELGYKKYDNHPEADLPLEPNTWVTQDERVIEYTQKETIKGVFYTLSIRFHLSGKVIEIVANERRNEITRYRNPILNVNELKAINEKVKELGWYD